MLAPKDDTLHNTARQQSITRATFAAQDGKQATFAAQDGEQATPTISFWSDSSYRSITAEELNIRVMTSSYQLCQAYITSRQSARHPCYDIITSAMPSIHHITSLSSAHVLWHHHISYAKHTSHPCDDITPTATTNRFRHHSTSLCMHPQSILEQGVTDGLGWTFCT
jgi:hypothetical protein